jgi:hypothetical protein
MNQPAYPLELLTQSTAKRLDYFKSCTIAHPRLHESDQALRAAISEPTGELLIFFYGPTGVGKTTVLNRCRRQIIEERRKEIEGDPGWIPVVSMEAVSPERGDFNWRDYYIDALRAFDEPLINHKIQIVESGAERKNIPQPVPRRIDSRSALRVALESAIRHRRPIGFFIDEAQHLTKISGGRKLQDQLDCLKSLAIRTNTVHVLAGTYELLILRQLSGQLSRRTRQIHLARYHAESAKDLRDFKNILWNFQIRMPLKSETDLMGHWEFCYERSLGCIGLLKDWLTRVLAASLSEKSPKVTIKHLERQALPISDCQKIASEILEGEASLAESECTRKRLRTLLSLEEVKAPRESAIAGGRSATPPKRGRPAQLVGERNPKRDPVGVAHNNDDESLK